jgi:hypothetical protein
MIDAEFDPNKIAAVNFGVKLRSTGQQYFVPTNDGVQAALKGILASTMDAFNAIDGAWQAHDVSEDYGERRRVYAARNGALMAGLSAVFDAAAPPDLANLDQHLGDLDSYLGVFWDDQGRKAVGIKKATRFKGTLAAQNRLIRLVDDTLVLIPEKVLKLDHDFDAVITNQHVFMLNVAAVAQVGDFVRLVAEAAQDRVQQIHDTVVFLDLSRIKAKIEHHPRMARLACSIAERPDLGMLSKEKVVRAATDHGVRFKEVDGRLLCNVTDEAKLLEVLDARRYHSDLTQDEPVPYRASGRQRVA